MQQTQPTTGRVLPGWKVVGSDDREIGQVSDLGPNYLQISKGLILPKTLYVPLQYVDHEDDLDERVFLRVGKDVIDTMGWDTPPGVGDEPDTGIDVASSTSGDDAWRMRG